MTGIKKSPIIKCQWGCVASGSLTADGYVKSSRYWEHCLTSSIEAEGFMYSFDLEIPFQVINATEMSTKW